MRQQILSSLAVLAVGLAAMPALGADLHVPSNYSTIAAALAAAGAGDRVVVAPGVYREYNLDLPSGVVLYGDPSDPDRVVIDARGRGRVLRAENLGLPAVIEGVTLTGGNARGANSYDDSGGGLLVNSASVRLRDTRVVANRAMGNGGGLRVTCGVVDLVRCELRGNTAGRGGGGLEACYGATCLIAHTDVAANTAAWGGGMAVRYGSAATILDTRFVANRAAETPGLGGALACDLDATLALMRCLVADNEARYGGALYTASGAAPVVVSATIDRNDGSVSGGGFYCKNSAPQLHRAIVSCQTSQAFACQDGGEPVLSESNVFGNVGGDWVGAIASQLGVNNNFSADPLYCAPNDRRLAAASPCLEQNNGFGLVGAFGQGCGAPTDVPGATPVVSLSAQPNPFNPLTEIVYSLPRAGRVRLTVFDVRGRRLRDLVDAVQPAGEHRVRWEARDEMGRAFASGAYLLVLEADRQRLTTKLSLVR